MTPPLTKQEQRVYTYILTHRGCTTRDIQRDTFIECPSARITGLRHKGVAIRSIGKRKYPGANAFECYAIEKPLTRTVSKVEIVNGVAVERRVEEPVQLSLV